MVKLNAKIRLQAAEQIDKKMLSYLLRNKVGGLYLAAWKECANLVPDRYLEPFTLAIKLMNDGEDFDDAINQVNLGTSKGYITDLLKQRGLNK